jgi:hypothetical protein
VIWLKSMFLTGYAAALSKAAVRTDSKQVWEVQGPSICQLLCYGTINPSKAPRNSSGGPLFCNFCFHGSSLSCFHRGSSLKSKGQDPRRIRWAEG